MNDDKLEQNNEISPVEDENGSDQEVTNAGLWSVKACRNPSKYMCAVLNKVDIALMALLEVTRSKPKSERWVRYSSPTHMFLLIIPQRVSARFELYNKDKSIQGLEKSQIQSDYWSVLRFDFQEHFIPFPDLIKKLTEAYELRRRIVSKKREPKISNSKLTKEEGDRFEEFMKALDDHRTDMEETSTDQESSSQEED